MRISRKDEYKILRPGLCRLYQAEAEELLRHLNGVPSEHGSGLLGSLGPHSYRGRKRFGASMRPAAGSLMRVIARKLRDPADYVWLGHALAQFLKVNEAPWLEGAATSFCSGSSDEEVSSWSSFALGIVFRSAAERSTGPQSAERERRTAAEPANSRLAWPLAKCDKEIRDEVIELHYWLKKYGGHSSFDERRSGITASVEKGYLSQERGIRQLRALEYLEINLAGIEDELELYDVVEDLSIVAAIQIFEEWVLRQLKTAGTDFRLVLDRLTSTYRLVPAQACGRLDDPNHFEQRQIEAQTVLSACLISYLTLQGIEHHIEEWVDAVGLIDLLGFANVLERFFRCPVCGCWVYAIYTRRDYCSNKCRYRVWMTTAKGLEKRRKASAAYRQRFSEEIRRATPRIKRRKLRQ